MHRRVFAARGRYCEFLQRKSLVLDCGSASFAGRSSAATRVHTASLSSSSSSSNTKRFPVEQSNTSRRSSQRYQLHCLQQQQQQQQQRRRRRAPPPAAAASMADSSSSSSPRVLSIQSSVVHGYVGNKSAVFPLQLLGFEVDPAYTVQFSNHTGYPTVKGHVFDGAHLLQLLEGLAANSLICHTHLLTGYIGSLSLLEAVATVAAALREHNPGLTYVCDPVLGDEGKLYVSQDLVNAYAKTLLPLANIITPNQFEAECLTGLTVKSQADALAAAAALHDKGPHTVVITSMVPLPHPEYSPPPSNDSLPQQQQQQQLVHHQQQQQQQQYITLIASTRVPQADRCPSTFKLQIPQLPGYFTGTGDLLCALLLAWTHKHPDNLSAAVEKAVAGLQGVLQVTAAEAGPQVLASTSNTAAVFCRKELKLIQGQHLLANPLVKIHAEPI